MFRIASCLIFFFKQKTAYEMRISDWSSDVCSSDLTTTPTSPKTALSWATASVFCERSMPYSFVMIGAEWSAATGSSHHAAGATWRLSIDGEGGRATRHRAAMEEAGKSRFPV